jgi:hypothetical protein
MDLGHGWYLGCTSRGVLYTGSLGSKNGFSSTDRVELLFEPKLKKRYLTNEAEQY